MLLLCGIRAKEEFSQGKKQGAALYTVVLERHYQFNVTIFCGQEIKLQSLQYFSVELKSLQHANFFLAWKKFATESSGNEWMLDHWYLASSSKLHIMKTSSKQKKKNHNKWCKLVTKIYLCIVNLNYLSTYAHVYILFHYKHCVNKLTFLQEMCL